MSSEQICIYKGGWPWLEKQLSDDQNDNLRTWRQVSFTRALMSRQKGACRGERAEARGKHGLQRFTLVSRLP